MTKNLRITTVQTSLLWENATANVRNFNKHLSTIKPASTDLILIPEMFSTGFSMRPSVFAEKEGGPSMQWMADTASQLKAVVCGSLMIAEKKKYFNRLIWMRPDGSYESYNKRHLFRMGNEDAVYSAGKERKTIELKSWNVCPMICYDLRFPVWSRNKLKGKSTALNYEYDLLLYVANWPAVRHAAWQHLLPARAIENQCYVAGVNRIGKDGAGRAHDGGSCIYDPFGNILHLAGKRSDVTTTLLEKELLNDYRNKFPALLDSDKFTL